MNTMDNIFNRKIYNDGYQVALYFLHVPSPLYSRSCLSMLVYLLLSKCLVARKEFNLWVLFLEFPELAPFKNYRLEM